MAGKLVYQRIREIGMPLFYLKEEELETPEVQIKASLQSTRTEDEPEKYRSDKILEDQPFLSSTHAFRYKL